MALHFVVLEKLLVVVLEQQPLPFLPGNCCDGLCRPLQETMPILLLHGWMVLQLIIDKPAHLVYRPTTKKKKTNSNLTPETELEPTPITKP